MIWEAFPRKNTGLQKHTGKSETRQDAVPGTSNAWRTRDAKDHNTVRELKGGEQWMRWDQILSETPRRGRVELMPEMAGFCTHLPLHKELATDNLGTGAVPNFCGPLKGPIQILFLDKYWHGEEQDP
ncbi:hypothetical protein B0H11DRAFT_1908636 [Mycena galericulata]|nr:hypothetical protein B0H11DRAFT_1908636 [Mycena galericulata]